MPLIKFASNFACSGASFTPSINAHSKLILRCVFSEYSRQAGLKQFLTYYLIAAHPGCTEGDMRCLKQFASRELHIYPEQVQLFTPLPSTYSALMYYTGLDPFTLKPLFVEKDPVRREKQKQIIVEKPKKM